MRRTHQNRSVAVDFEVSEDEYIRSHGDLPWFLQKITVVMCIVMLSMHHIGCPLKHRYTRHSTRSRSLLCLLGSMLSIPISQIRCLDCLAVFTVLPSFVLRYQHYHVRLAQALLEYNVIMNVSYRFQSRMLEHLSPTGTDVFPMSLWRLMKWLGTAIPVTALLLKLGLEAPTVFLEDEKFVSEAGHQTYIAALFQNDIVWYIKYLQSTDTQSMTQALLEYKATVQAVQPEYAPEVATVDRHAPTQAALAAVFPGIAFLECHLHAQRSVNRDLATFRRLNPETPEEDIDYIGTGTWAALTESTSVDEFVRRIELLKTRLNGEPVLTARMDKLIARREHLMQHLKTPSASKTSTPIDQVFKWLDRKFFQMQSFMSETGAAAFANAWAIARNFWRFMKGAKRAGQSPVELAGCDLSGKPWLELVNLCAYGSYSQA